MKHMLLKRRRG